MISRSKKFLLASVDGQAAFLGERSDHTHIDYSQGLEKFRERGLPCQLPASRRSLVASCRKTLTRLALRQHQEEWVRERRDWKILTRGKEQPHDLCRIDLVHSLCLLIPEPRRLAQRMASDEPLSPGAVWGAMRDLTCTLSAAMTCPCSISQGTSPLAVAVQYSTVS
jgi:hypothetical protein